MLIFNMEQAGISSTQHDEIPALVFKRSKHKVFRFTNDSICHFLCSEQATPDCFLNEQRTEGIKDMMCSGS